MHDTAEGAQAEDLWHVEVSEGDIKVVTLEQLDDAFDRGFITQDTRIWQEGMAAAMRLGDLLAADDEDDDTVREPASVHGAATHEGPLTTVAALAAETEAPSDEVAAYQRAPQDTLMGISAAQVQDLEAARAAQLASYAAARAASMQPSPVTSQPPASAASDPPAVAGASYPPPVSSAASYPPGVAGASYPPPVSRAASYPPAVAATAQAPSIPAQPPAVAGPSIAPLAFDIGDDPMIFARPSRGKRVGVAVFGLGAVAAAVAVAVNMGGAKPEPATPPVSAAAAQPFKSRAYEVGSEPLELDSNSGSAVQKLTVRDPSKTPVESASTRSTSKPGKQRKWKKPRKSKSKQVDFKGGKGKSSAYDPLNGSL